MENALVILCGGSSTRMGTDKALLPFGDSCLIEYLVQKFKPYFSNIYLSVKIKGDYAHLNLPVTEIPDIYPNAGPMSGIFSSLSMMDEERAFFMSVDTPFLEPQTGIALLDAMGNADICTIRGKATYLETATAAYSKNCITTIGKCLLLHQLTFPALREKCATKYVTEKAIAQFTPVPIDLQFQNLDTRADYYNALRIFHDFKYPHSSDAFLKYFENTKDLFLHTTPVFSFTGAPGTFVTPFVERLIPLLEREGLKVIHLIREEESVIFANAFSDVSTENLSAVISGADVVLTENFKTPSPNRIEVVQKDSPQELPLNDNNLIAVLSDFPCHLQTNVPVFEIGKPKNFITFLLEHLF